MNPFTSWKDKISEYVDVRVGLFKLSLIERTSTLLATMIMSFIFLGIGLAVLTFIGWGLMEYFIVLLDSRVGGAFLTAGVFAILFGVFYSLRKKIVTSFAGIFIQILTHKSDGDDDPADKEMSKVKVDGD